MKNVRSIGGVRVDPKRLNTSTESQRSSERGVLVSYFRDIAEISTLKKEEEVLLAKEIEAAVLAFREGMVAVPWTAMEAVRIWRGLKAENRATGKMCESFGSGSPEGQDLGAVMDGIMGKIEVQLERREKAINEHKLDTAIRHEKRAAKLLKEADLSMQLLARMRKGMVDLRVETARGRRRIAALEANKRPPTTDSGKAPRKAELERWRGRPRRRMPRRAEDRRTRRRGGRCARARSWVPRARGCARPERPVAPRRPTPERGR